MTNGREPRASGKQLRHYAIAIYKRDGVSSACLLLQNAAQVDVNLLLFAAWAASNDIAVSLSDIRRAKAVVGPWHAEIVKPLRSVRQRMKHGPPPAPSEQTSALRQQLQAIEIALELLELDELDSFAKQLKNEPVHADQRLNVIMRALELVVTESAGRDLQSDETAAIEQIARTCDTYSAEGSADL